MQRPEVPPNNGLIEGFSFQRGKGEFEEDFSQVGNGTTFRSYGEIIRQIVFCVKDFPYLNRIFLWGIFA